MLQIIGMLILTLLIVRKKPKKSAIYLLFIIEIMAMIVITMITEITIIQHATKIIAKNITKIIKDIIMPVTVTMIKVIHTAVVITTTEGTRKMLPTDNDRMKGWSGETRDIIGI